MKQVSYDFDWVHVVIGMVDLYQMEDGFWRIELVTESVTTNLPQLLQGQKPEAYPSHLVRIIGVRLTKVEGPGYMVYEVKDGEVQLGSYTNNSGSQEGGSSPGEDSGHTPAVSSPSYAVGC